MPQCRMYSMEPVLLLASVQIVPIIFCAYFFIFLFCLSSHPPDEQRSQSSPHDSQSNACPSTVDECFSDDDSVFIRQHGDFMHEEKILASHMSAADTRVIRKATKIIMYVGLLY